MLLLKYIGCLLLTLVLATVPPFSSLVEQVLQRWWMPSRLSRAVSLMHGAHESLIASEACRLGVFEAIDQLNNPLGVTPWLTRLTSSAAAMCIATPEAVATRGNFDVRFAESLLDALASMLLVRRRGNGFCNEPIVESFLLDAAGEDNLCGMGVASNHREVLWRLASLDEAAGIPRPSASLPKHATFLRASTTPHSLAVADGQLWSTFAASTGAFSRRIAARVARLVLATMASSSPTVSEIAVYDIGCGSGEYLRVLADHVSSSSTTVSLKAGVYVDLPDVLVETERLHALYSKTKDEPPPPFRFVGVSIFDDNAFQRVVEDPALGVLPVIMMNSFLQHFSDGTVAGVLQRAVQHIRRNCGTAVCGYVFVTELVQRASDASWLEAVLHEPLVPMTAIFDLVLKAFTAEGGGVRTAKAYIALAESVGLVLVNHGALTPMPAALLAFRIDR